MQLRTCLSLLSVACVLYAPNVGAAPVTISGARFDAPTGCSVTERALVCKLDGAHLELWVNRKPLADHLEAEQPFAQRMAWFHDVHETAVANIMRSTFNDKRSGFVNYGSYSALGTTLPGKGSATSPAVRFASVMHEDSYWEFLEVAPVRSAAVDAVATVLEMSLQLPKSALPPQPLTRKEKPGAAAIAAGPADAVRATTVPSATPQAAVAPDSGSSPLSASFKRARFSFEHPGYLGATVLTESASELRVQLEPKGRKAGGPVISLSWRAAGGAGGGGDSVERRAEVLREERLAAYAGAPQVATLQRFGALSGRGFAMLGMAKATTGVGGSETLHTLFVADTVGGRFEITLNADQAYGSEAQAAWAMIAQALLLRP